jgi:hypothetical protein
VSYQETDKLNITGLDELQRKIEQMRRNAEQLDGTHEVTLTEIFPPAFMRKHSSVTDFDAFCREANLDVSSAEAFRSIPTATLDAAVKHLTQFSSWEEMKQAGAGDWASRRLFDGVRD